jgi:hydrogenase expression/formation protein HypE
MTTDSFVVSPLFFPGGDIGSLAVFGTVNDLVVSGARPLWLSLAFIIEEGLELDVLSRVLESIAAAAKRVGVEVVTGDTKVVPRGAADRLFINTAGIGEIRFAPNGPERLREGDRILVTGPIGRHGMAVMTSREGLEFDPPPRSDCAPLVDAVQALYDAGIEVRAMRDATRGGVAAVLHEWAGVCGMSLCVDEPSLPVTAEVRGACEVLGLDPIHVANEGTMVLAVGSDQAEQALAALRAVPVSQGSVCIGQVVPATSAAVIARRVLGQEIPLDEPLGAPLPRIC